jgi:hypothetical protein
MDTVLIINIWTVIALRNLLRLIGQLFKISLKPLLQGFSSYSIAAQLGVPLLKADAQQWKYLLHAAGKA